MADADLTVIGNRSGNAESLESFAQRFGNIGRLASVPF